MQYLVSFIFAHGACNRICRFCQYFLTKIIRLFDKKEVPCGWICLIHADGSNPLDAHEGEVALQEAVVHVSQVHGSVEYG